MFTLNIDLGQIIIVTMLGVIGWFTKRTIEKVEKKIEQHENVIYSMNSNIQRIIGAMGIREVPKWDFNERRGTPREQS